MAVQNHPDFATRAGRPARDDDRSSLISTIDAFQTQMGTAVGSAIVLCVPELFPDHGISLGDITVQTRETELAPLPELVAAILVVAAGYLSELWFGRIT